MTTSIPLISIVIPTYNEGDDVLATVDCVLRHSPQDTQLIVVDDGSTDHSAAALRQLSELGKIELVRGENLGAIGARNAGAKLAQAPILGFLDAHCYTPPNWLQPLLHTFAQRSDIDAVSPVIACTKNPAARGYGASWHPGDDLDLNWLPFAPQVTEVPFIGGAATFVRKSAFDHVLGFDTGIVRWGYEDVELCVRLWLFGHPVAVVPGSVIYHKFRTEFRYDIPQQDLLYNKMRMIFLHFDGARLRRLLRHHLQYEGAEKVLGRLYSDGTESQRDDLFRRRLASMDSFCDRFRLVS